MKRFARQLVTVMTAAVLVLNSTPLGGIAVAWADDVPDQGQLAAPAAGGAEGQESLAPDEGEGQDGLGPDDGTGQDGLDPDHEGPHTYADGACTQCGRPLAWDIPLVGEDREDIDIFVDNADGTSTLLDDAGLREIAIIASCYKTDDPNYRFDIGLSAASAWLPTGYDTSAAYFAPNDVYVDTMAEFTAKYETLRYTFKLNENHEPQMFDVSGGTAEVVLLSQYDPETGTYDNLSPYGNPQFKLVFHLQPAQPGPVPDEVATVDSRSMGFTVNLYDYQTGSDEKGTAAEDGINAISDLQFFEGADPSTADDSADSNALSDSSTALQGIVGPELGDDGYPTLTEFDGSSLEVLFDTQGIDGAKDVYGDVNHLFQMDDGYLVYNSDHNYAYYDTSQGSGGDFTVYDGTYNQARQTDLALIDSGVPIGFFPLNAYNDLNNLAATKDDSSLTHNLGMSIDTSFKLSASGKVDGEDLTFEYTGDDDAWLFIDDVLVLDAGGIHSKLNASVDFATGEVSVGSASALEAAERTIGRGSTLEQIFADAGKTWEQEGTHTLRFYSLERDGGQSDLVIKTNLWKVVDTELTDVAATKEWVDVDGNECDPWLDSVTVQLYQTVDGTTTKVDGKTLALSADNDWTDAFTSLPATDEDGNRITYSVKEEQADGAFATYEVGGVTQSTKVYWVRYDASDGVEPGIYAVLSMDGDQPVLLTSREAEGEEIEYTDVFFENGPVTDGATGETYEQYISPVRDNEIWTISRTAPQQYVTRTWDYSDGYQVTDDGYTVYSPSPNYPGQFYVKDDKVYVKDSSGKYQPVMGTVTKEGDSSYRITNDGVSFTSEPTGDFERNEDGYIILMMQTGPATYSTYYTTDAWDAVYRQNPNGTYTKVVEGSVPSNYFPRPLYDTTEDGYVVLKGDDGNTYYGDPDNGTVYRKTSDGSYAPVMLGTLYIYALPSYTETWSDDFEWQIANQGLYLTLVGPGQQWMDYTYVTSTNEEQHVTNDMVQRDAASSSGWNYRNVFRLDLWKDYERNYGGGDSTLSYDQAGLRVYSFQGLWQFTGLITGYEKNLAVSSTYNTKETYMTQQAGSYWLYKPIYEEAPLKLADTDWTVINHPAGDLAITKAVTGSGASSSDEFTFTIKLTGETDAAKSLVNEVNGTFGDIDFVGGMATVTLRGGETKTAKNLPAGVSYTVTETVLPGYALASKTGDTGTIPARSTVTASFTNSKDAPETPTPTPASASKPAKMAPAAVPKTGDATVSTWVVVAIAGLGCGLVGVGTVARRSRRRDR